MTTATRQPGLFEFDDSYARAVPRLSVAWQAARFPAPRLLVLNDELAVELGADPSALREPSGIALLAGQEVPEGVTTVAQAYAGHQFGTFVPRLGDGRALLLGEVVDTAGRRRDVHLKGSGRTPFARGGDGLAAVGPMLREYVMGEAMHALGIPTTRGLAVLATGQTITRETPLPGALLVRVAASHLRVGTFQYASSIGTTTGDVDVLRALADHAIARHHPSAAADANPYLSLFGRVVDVQAELVARWMLVGFVHGVMNTDNTTISGETIDYGPCAFLDAFDPATRFSSIDHRGRYAYGNQPQIAQWNLARLGETLLPLIDGRGGVEGTDAAVEAATAELSRFAQVYDRAWQAGLAAKLGLAQPDRELVQEFLQLLKAERADFTNAFRLLADHLRGRPLRDHFLDRAAVDAWVARWEAALPDDRAAVADGMDRVNPLYIPRNHKVEEALAAATAGDLAPLHRLVEVLARPFERRPGQEAYAEPGEGAHVTYCGT